MMCEANKGEKKKQKNQAHCKPKTLASAFTESWNTFQLPSKLTCSISHIKGLFISDPVTHNTCPIKEKKAYQGLNTSKTILREESKNY